MGKSLSLLWYFCVLLFHVGALSPSECDQERQEIKNLTDEYLNYRTLALLAVKQIFDGNQNCPSQLNKKLKKELAETKTKLEEMAEVATALANEKSPAHLPRPHVIASLNTSYDLSCESYGEPLSSCLWGRTFKGRRQMILVDKDGVQDGRRTGIHGISHLGNNTELQNGKCSLGIHPVTPEDFGTWFCTLIGTSGVVLTGQVEVTTKEPEASIFLVTDGGGVVATSVTTSQVTTLFNTKESLFGVTYNRETLFGVTYNSIQNKIYWTTWYTIYRGNRDGSQMEELLYTKEYGTILALEFDSITGNIYASSVKGFILACDAKLTRTFSCATVRSDQLDVGGLALNPNKGMMYWTLEAGSIVQAGMDGSSPVTLVSGLRSPRGITIDFQSTRLYWTCKGDNTVQSSTMEGKEIRTVISLPSGSEPYGVGVFGERIYWTNYESKTLQSSTKTGQDVRTLHTGSRAFFSLVAVSNFTTPTNRTNPCESQRCSKVCVLTPTSFSCLS